jgi:hypothetical protein
MYCSQVATSGSYGHSAELRAPRDDLVNPYWFTDRDLGGGPERLLDVTETQFWRKLIDKYLYPIDADKAHESKIANDLKILRNNAVFLFFMLNFLWLFIIFLLQIVQEQLQVSYLTLLDQLLKIFWAEFTMC